MKCIVVNPIKEYMLFIVHCYLVLYDCLMREDTKYSKG